MYENILKMYEDLGDPSGRQLKRFPEFVNKVKKQTSWLESQHGRVEFKLRMFCVINDIYDHPICPVCNTNKVNNRGDKFSKTCSKKCAGELSMSGFDIHPMHTEITNIKRKSTNIEKYGVDNPFKSSCFQEKAKQVIKERYGVENVSQLEEVKQKRKKTNMERYGVEYSTQNKEIYQRAVDTLVSNYGVTSPLQSEEIYQKARSTIRERYGVEHFTQLKNVQDKKKETNLERYGVEHVTQKGISEEVFTILLTPEILQEHYDTFGSATHAAVDLGVDTSTYISYLSKHQINLKPSGRVSFAEREIQQFLSNNNINFTTSDRSILGGLECDIVIEEHKIIIEYNGVYWHSELFRDRLYHQRKSLMAIEKGYTIIHVWEDDWATNKQLILNKILHKCGVSTQKVYARKCVVNEVKTLKSFYDKNHIQGNINSSINICLTYDGEIVAGMSFKKHKDGWDLTRFATNRSVVGGFSKLLSYFKKNHSGDIITFASLDYSNGDLYRSMGFEEVGVTPPNYHYVKNGKRFSRNQFMKHLLHKKLENFDESLSEHQNMRNHGFIRIYDCGSIKFKL